MTAPPALPVEQAAETHAQHIVLGDSAAMHQDCIAQVRQEPPDLYARLGTATLCRAGPCQDWFAVCLQNTLFGCDNYDRTPPLRRGGGAVARAGERTRLGGNRAKVFTERSARP
jgi:hypothetical protein